MIDGWEKEELMGTETKNEHDCGLLVQQERPMATGATYYKKYNQCWAEYGTSIHESDIYRACIFLGMIYNHLLIPILIFLYIFIMKKTDYIYDVF